MQNQPSLQKKSDFVEDFLAEHGHLPGYNVTNFGCQMNECDTEIIATLLDNMGMVPAEITEADVIVYYTCSVRHSAENKVYSRLGGLRSLKDKKPELIIALGGCMPQLPENRERLKGFPVDIIFGTHNFDRLPDLLKTYGKRRKRLVEVWEQHRGVRIMPYAHSPKLNAFVNITYGCDNFCTFCIVPFTRGRERSRQPEDIVAEVRYLAESGTKEVTLLGQNVNSYGKGLEESCNFGDLLRKINAIDGLARIRFTTSHPRDLSNRLIDSVAACDKVCEYFHVALQSGSDRILKKMNRHYDSAYYLDMVSRIRACIPGVAIGTDIIVGFPGETEDDFQQTLALVERIGFDASFNFVFSPRKGTKAAALSEQISAEVKKDRIVRLNDLQHAIAARKNESLINQIVEVLVEGPSKSNPDKMTGRTRSNKIVNFRGVEQLPGTLIKVKIVETGPFSLTGELL